MIHKIHYSQKAPEPVGPYPHARQIGPWVFLSGMGPRKRGSQEIPWVNLNQEGKVLSYDIEVQTTAVFENISMILEELGGSLENLVDITVFLTNMKKDFSRFNKIYQKFLGEIQPTRTTVEVGSLPTPIAVELKCIAFLAPLT